jgi:hypothetical protein
MCRSFHLPLRSSSPGSQMAGRRSAVVNFFAGAAKPSGNLLEPAMDPKPEVSVVDAPLSAPLKKEASWIPFFFSLLGCVAVWGVLAGARWAFLETDVSRGAVSTQEGWLAGLLVALGTGWIGALIRAQKRELSVLNRQLEEMNRRLNQQGEGVLFHLQRMEAEWGRLEAREEATAEPLLNFTGARVDPNALHITFENVGATVMELSVVCETPGFFAEVQPRLALRTGDSGRLVVVRSGEPPEADPTVRISYVTRLGARKTKQYAVPSDGSGWVAVDSKG